MYHRTPLNRFDTNYQRLVSNHELTVLTPDDFTIAEVKAKVLNFDEILDYLCLVPSEVPNEELELLRRAHKRGRISAISTAADKLFSAMDSRNGHQASLAYLQQISSTFKLDINPVSSGSGFKFNVVLNEDTDTD